MTETPPGVVAGRRDRLHGRRRGHKLRPAQQTRLDTGLAARQSSVAAVAASGPAGIFPVPPREIWLEVGFGGGEHIAWQAAQNPDVGLIGCEVFETGIVTLLAHLSGAAEDNVRIIVDDAHLVLDVLPEASLARAFILFPDPWPKTRHHKRRFVSRETMDLLARVLRCGAELRLGTDDVAYMRVMLEVACGHPDFEWLARRPADWRERPADWPQTRYEAKAIAQGRPPAFLRLIRRPRPTTV
jgi:tRNA (guanine-N7-)-methyltransferase